MSNSLWPPWTIAHQASLTLGILQARILEWVAMDYPGIEPRSPALQEDSLQSELPGKTWQERRSITVKSSWQPGTHRLLGYNMCGPWPLHHVVILQKQQRGRNVSVWVAGKRGFLGGSVVKNPPLNAGDIRDLGLILGLGRFHGEGNGNCPSVLAWRIPWTEELSGLQSLGLQRVGQDWSNLAHRHRKKRGEEGHGGKAGLYRHLVFCRTLRMNLSCSLEKLETVKWISLL